MAGMRKYASNKRNYASDLNKQRLNPGPPESSIARRMAASIIAIGNPGAGKSTILNSLAGQLLFKSGVSIGEGLTYQLDEGENERGIFYDTPGLADDTHREAAGKAISAALRKGGPFKILFFVRLESGRLVHEDITTFKLVLNSAPEIGNKYGIITNKLPDNVAKQLEKPGQAEKLLTKLFASISKERRCAPSNITYLPHKPEADSEDNILIDSKTLKTLDGKLFEHFVYSQLPTVQLTANAAKDIETDDFDKMTAVIQALEKKMEADKQMFQEQQKLLLQQLDKAEKAKQEQRQIDKEMFNQQMNLMKDQMAQKEREIEQARDDSVRREQLQQEQMMNQLENQRLEFQNQMEEKAESQRMRDEAEAESQRMRDEEIDEICAENADIRASLDRKKNKGGCFPGESVALLNGGEKISMEQLRIGDVVMTLENGELTPTTVLGFLGKEISQMTEYLNLITDDDRSLFIGLRHAMFIKDENIIKSVLAKDIKIGNVVMVKEGGKTGFAQIKEIIVTAKTGAYVPLTDAGTLLVDGVLVSCYTNGDHWVAHMFAAPLRWWPTILLDTEESQDLEGIRTFPGLIRDFANILGFATMAE